MKATGDSKMMGFGIHSPKFPNPGAPNLLMLGRPCLGSNFVLGLTTDVPTDKPSECEGRNSMTDIAKYKSVIVRVETHKKLKKLAGKDKKISGIWNSISFSSHNKVVSISC